MQRADREFFLADQRIQQRGLAGADATESRDVQMAMLQFVQHSFDRSIIMDQGLANAGRQSRILDQVTKAFLGERKVPGTTVILLTRLRLFAGPGPIWPLAEHPFQYVH